MVKSTKGAVSIQRAGQTLQAQAGSPVLVADVIVTGADSAVGITLQDGTLLSAGPQSTLAINRFVFDSTTSQGELDSSLKRGTLAVVSGKLSKASPQAVTYRTPTAILGVRGTEFVIQAKPQ
ncbi:FecR family protein [Pseudomonas sp. N040]|uniref:FecR family protein n=1 Tax=Pseudomonas sp. N040 TaxID=2785325 RepID=UPI001C615A7B|nr:FecR domain-containing protein [Pseudomonas sp. N040]MBW7012402.1 FecR domain-containing protein [Pseudomonas sp. N040]